MHHRLQSIHSCRDPSSRHGCTKSFGTRTTPSSDFPPPWALRQLLDYLMRLPDHPIHTFYSLWRCGIFQVIAMRDTHHLVLSQLFHFVSIFPPFGSPSRFKNVRQTTSKSRRAFFLSEASAQRTDKGPSVHLDPPKRKVMLFDDLRKSLSVHPEPQKTGFSMISGRTPRVS